MSFGFEHEQSLLFGKQLLRSALFVVLIASVIPFCLEVRIYNSFDLGFIVHFYLSNFFFSDIVGQWGFEVDRND